MGTGLADRVCWVLAGLIFAAVGLDFLLNDGTAFVFLAQKVLKAVEALAFWRH